MANPVILVIISLIVAKISLIETIEYCVSFVEYSNMALNG